MRDYDGAVVLGAIRQIQQASTTEAVVSALGGFIAPYGFERIFLGQLVNPANVALKNILYLSDWPDELQAQRRQQMAVLHDPIAICALRSKRPFMPWTVFPEACRWGDATGWSFRLSRYRNSRLSARAPIITLKTCWDRFPTRSSPN